MIHRKTLVSRGALLLPAVAIMGGALSATPANAGEVLPPDGTTSGPAGPCGGAGTIKFSAWSQVMPLGNVFYWGSAQNCFSSTQRLRLRFNVTIPGASPWSRCTSVAPGAKLTISSPSYEATGWGYC